MDVSDPLSGAVPESEGVPLPEPIQEDAPVQEPVQPPETPPEPQGDPGAPAVGAPAVEGAPEDLKAKIAALEKRLDEVGKPPDVAQEPQKTPDQIAYERAEGERVQRENTHIATANRLETDERFMDEMIAEHGQRKVDAYIRDAYRIVDRRENARQFQSWQAQQQEKNNEELSRQEWAATRKEMGANAKSLGLKADVFEKDDALQGLLGLAHPDKYTKQAIKDRLFVIAHTQGVPGRVQTLVTAEDLAARHRASDSGGGSPSNPKGQSISQQMLDSFAAHSAGIDPLANSKPV